MKTNDSANACPKCGAPVPAEAPEGLCPRCVLAAAVAPEPAPTATSQIPSLERLAVAFPQLQIIELIGRGGMGFVFKARQPHLDRFVALKLLPDSLAHDPQFAERFNREGRVLARLNHPNIVSIFDFGQAGGFYYLMMEYVDGVNLRQAMQAGRFSPAEALTIVPKICEALQFAHEEGILHRDIKPENILLDAKGRVKIADFGIAKLVGEDKPDVSLTATGAALGTMHYMAPEQIEKPSTVDHRADIYSLGVVFYELLTGELPLGRFGPPSAKTPVDSRVDDVVMRTLEREREKRFQSAGEMGTTVEHLTEVGAGTPAPALTTADDFILCPPRLPRMAKAIIFYALVLAPLFWLLGLFTIEPLPEHALVKFVQGALNVLIAGVEFLVLVVFAIGAWKLRALRTSAVGWLKTAFWLHLGLTVVAIAGQIWVEVLTDQLIPNAPAKHLGLGEGVVVAVVLATLIFEISALVWLRRHGALLKSFLKSGAAPKGPRGTMVIPPSAVVSPAPAWSLKAVWAAVLTAVSLPLPMLLIFLAYLKIFRGGGLGGWEILLLLIVAFFPGLFGNILGWMGLSDIRAHQGQRRGLPLAVFAALAWPLLLPVTVTLSVPTMLAYRAAGGGSPGSLLAIFVPAGTLTFAIWAVYTAARWGANKPTSHRHGVLKWVFLALILFGVAVTIQLRGRSSRAAQRIPSAPRQAVELLAVSAYPSDGKWWHADGTPSSESYFSVPIPLPENHGRAAYQFVFRGSPWLRKDPVSCTYRFSGASGWSPAYKPSQNDQTLSNGFCAIAMFPKEQRATSIRVGEASGEWIDSVTLPPSGQGTLIGGGQTLAFLGSAPGPIAGTTLTLSNTTVDREVRVLARDTNGREHIGSGEKPTPEGHDRFLFASLAPQNVREFQVQVRFYRWSEFANVPLQLAAGTEVPWIRFTFTAVELREVKGVRWLAIDYLDDVHGECDKSFPWETTIPGFKAETRTTEFVTDAKDSSPAVRHQRIEYRMPDSSPRDQLEKFRDALARNLIQKSFKVELDEEKSLFEFRNIAGGALQAWIKVVPPLKTATPGQRQTPWEQAQASVERVRKQNEAAGAATAAAKSPALEFRLIADATDTKSPVDELPERHKDGSETKLRVLRTVMLDGSSVARAGIEFEPNGFQAIGVELTAEGARQFGAITAANIDRQLAIVSNGRVLSAPIIKTAIRGGELKISGSFSPAEVGKLVGELNREPSGLEFSPIIERSLPRAPKTPSGSICLDLDSGLFMTNQMFRIDQRGTRDWLQTSGADLIAIGAANQIPVLAAFDLASIEVPADAWDSMLAQDVGWNWALMQGAAKQESQLAVMPGRPDTFLFRTRENGFGLLQFLSVTNPGPEVKIRFKLVQSEKGDADEIRIRLAREELAAARKKFEAGLLSQYDLAQAERRFAVAEAQGDAATAARTNLKFAEEALAATKERFEKGVVSQVELKFAENRHALAVTDLSLQLSRKQVQELRGKLYTDEHPALKSILHLILDLEQQKARQEKAQ